MDRLLARVQAEISAACENDDRDEITPLYFASSIGHLDMVKFLQSKGASVDQPENDGTTQEKVRREGQHFGQDLAELARLVRNARVHLQENAALQELFGVDTGSDDAIAMDCKVAHHFAAALPSLFVCLIEWRS